MKEEIMEFVHIRRQWLSIAVLLACAASVAFGQNAQLSGKVSDPSGAVMSGVAITITNTEDGAVRNLVTTDEGLYSAPSLQPGHYRLVAVKQGFKPLVREGLTLQVSDDVRLDLKLGVGGASEQVTVT